MTDGGRVGPDKTGSVNMRPSLVANTLAGFISTRCYLCIASSLLQYVLPNAQTLHWTTPCAQTIGRHCEAVEFVIFHTNSTETTVILSHCSMYCFVYTGTFLLRIFCYAKKCVNGHFLTRFPRRDVCAEKLTCQFFHSQKCASVNEALVVTLYRCHATCVTL